jgi:AcrR family transcriptional regulator
MMTKKTASLNIANTRDRLLEAGMDVFGRHGYEAATTRMIAGKAGANIAAIPYYFSGKEGLYHAVVTHIAEKIELHLGTAFREIADLVPDENRGRGRSGERLQKPLEHPQAGGDVESSLDLLETLLGKLIDFMIGSPEARRYVRIFLREQLFPTLAYDILLNRVFIPIIESIARVVTLTSSDPSMHDAKLRATAILGQVMAFRVARETMVRALGMEGYSPGETVEIRRVILEQTRAIIASLGSSERTGSRRTE